MNTEDRAAYFLPRINSALRAEGAEMIRLEQTLSQILGDARALGELHVSPTNRADWNERWKEVQTSLEVLRSTLVEARHRIDAGAHQSAPPAPEDAHPRPHRLLELFLPLRTLGAAALPDSDQEHWRDMWSLIEANAACIRAHILHVSLQLRLRQKYQTQHSKLAEDVVEHSPKHASMVEVEKFGEEYRQAVHDMQRERQESGGLHDVLKALFMYVEAPEERVRNKKTREQELQESTAR